MSKNYGIKSSREGSDVLEFALPDGSVTSQYANPKIQLNQDPAHIDVLEYTFGSEPSADSTTTLLTVAHGYSYAPMQWAMIEVAAGTWIFMPHYVAGFLPVPPFSTFSDQFYSYTDGTNFYIKMKRVGDFVGGGGTAKNGTSWNFKYMIFAEDGS